MSINQLWLVFGIIIFILFAIDIFIINKRVHIVSIKEASIWSIICIAAALIFNTLIYFSIGPQKAIEFFTGFIIEKSLSIDNLFVFILIFSYFNVPLQYQPRVLKWGIIGAIFMRAVFIFFGIELIKLFHWMIYVFGTLLIITSFKIILQKDKKFEPEKNPAVKLFKKFFPVISDFHGQNFFVKVENILYATPLFIVLILIETSDIVFAIDSIPAILAITTDPFIVYTSNIFAVVGLRALFFLVSGMIEMFKYLKFGISIILCYVGIKMLVSDIYPIPTFISLGVIFSILVITICFSIVLQKKGE